MARGLNEPPIEQEQEEAPVLWLEFADGTRHAVDPMDAAAVLRAYVVQAPVIRSRRVFNLIVEYKVKRAEYHRGGVDAEPDINGWYRRFMEQVDDTDILHDLFLASEKLGEFDLMDLCAQKTADMVRGGTVEQIKQLLGVADDVTLEQDLVAQQDYDHLLRIIH